VAVAAKIDFGPSQYLGLVHEPPQGLLGGFADRFQHHWTPNEVVVLAVAFDLPGGSEGGRCLRRGIGSVAPFQQQKNFGRIDLPWSFGF